MQLRNYIYIYILFVSIQFCSVLVLVSSHALLCHLRVLLNRTLWKTSPIAEEGFPVQNNIYIYLPI